MTQSYDVIVSCLGFPMLAHKTEHETVKQIVLSMLSSPHKPDVFNHNMGKPFQATTSPFVRVRATSTSSASCNAWRNSTRLCSPSRAAWGLIEERNEVLQLMDDLRTADVDFLTIGQYLQPTRKHHRVDRFVTPDKFTSYETIASPIPRAS